MIKHMPVPVPVESDLNSNKPYRMMLRSPMPVQGSLESGLRTLPSLPTIHNDSLFEEYRGELSFSQIEGMKVVSVYDGEKNHHLQIRPNIISPENMVQLEGKYGLVRYECQSQLAFITSLDK